MTLPALLLREESFGGIIFDPFDGTQLDLDREAFALVRGPLPDRGLALRRMRELGEQLHGFPVRELREIALPPLPAADDGVLRAPTLIDFQITTRCDQACPHCYACSVEDGRDASLADVERVFREASASGVCQIALGGGDPLLHPDIGAILRLARELGLVPNLTTSGAHLSDTVLAAMKSCCGAVGLSCEGVGERYSLRRKMGFSAFEAALGRLLSAGIPTVVQVTVSAGNLPHLEEIVDYLAEKPLYGVIFLAFKPVGRGTVFDAPLSGVPQAQVVDRLGMAFTRLAARMRVGYDCCLAPAVVEVAVRHGGLAPDALEGCSATRGSVGVDSQLNVVPCTFLPEQVLGNLRTGSLGDIWRGAVSERFRAGQRRNAVRERCVTCPWHEGCRGGCPAMPLVACQGGGQGGRY